MRFVLHARFVHSARSAPRTFTKQGWFAALSVGGMSRQIETFAARHMRARAVARLCGLRARAACIVAVAFFYPLFSIPYLPFFCPFFLFFPYLAAAPLHCTPCWFGSHTFSGPYHLHAPLVPTPFYITTALPRPYRKHCVPGSDGLDKTGVV